MWRRSGLTQADAKEQRGAQLLPLQGVDSKLRTEHCGILEVCGILGGLRGCRRCWGSPCWCFWLLLLSPGCWSVSDAASSLGSGLRELGGCLWALLLHSCSWHRVVGDASRGG